MTADRHPAGLSPDWLIRARLTTPVPTVSEPLVAAFASRPGPAPLVVDIHEGLEVGIMLVGTAERHFQDFVLPGIPGDVWLCAMWEPHGRRVVSSYTENVVLQFIPEFLGEEIIGGRSWLSLFAVPPKDRPWAASQETRDEILAIGARLKQEIQDHPRFWQYSIRLHLLRLLFLLSRAWTPPPASAQAGGPPGASLLRVMPALNLLRDPRRGRITLAEAAAACRLSPSRFAVVFPRIMGVSFGKFALRARLAFAAHRLLTTDLSVDAIASEAGFTDASHLHRHFVRHYGQTPRSYRDRPSAPEAAPFLRN